MSIKNLYATKLSVQNPSVSEPVFTSVVINGNNILNSLEFQPPSNYNDPSVDEISSGFYGGSYLGTIAAGTDYRITPIVFVANSKITDPSVSFAIMPSNGLPPGLSISVVRNNSVIITGIVGSIPVTLNQYAFTMRITNSKKISVDRYFFFNVYPQSQILEWNYPDDGVHYLGRVNKGGTVNFPLQITNYLNKPLNYIITPPLPGGLSISNNAIYGRLDTSVLPNTYIYTISASDGTLSTGPNQFSFDIISNTNVSLQSSSITWLTTNTNLGSTYCLLSSFFSVRATSQSGLPIMYTIAPNSNPLPSSLILETNTGDITGLTPLVFIDTVYTITIRAIITTDVNYFYSSRTFTFKVLPQYNSNVVLSAIMPVEEPARLLIAEAIWNSYDIRDELLFRPNPNDAFGRVLQPSILIGSRSVLPVNQSNMQAFINAIKLQMAWYSVGVTVNLSGVTTTNNNDIHLDVATLNLILDSLKNSGNVLSIALNSLQTQIENIQLTAGDLELIKTGANINATPLKLTIGTLGQSAVYSADGQYKYDVIFANVLDPIGNAGSYVNEDTHVQVPVYTNKLNYPVKLYPKSLNNLRNDFVSNFDLQDIDDAGLPSSERTYLTSGWKPLIELIYTLPGKGLGVLAGLIDRGFEKKILGKEFTTGRVDIFDLSALAIRLKGKLGSFILGIDLLGYGSDGNSFTLGQSALSGGFLGNLSNSSYLALDSFILDTNFLAGDNGTAPTIGIPGLINFFILDTDILGA